MSNLLKNLVSILGLALVVWVGYTLFTQEDDFSLEAINSGGSGSILLESQDLLVQLNQLKNIQLNKDFFESENFASLVDFRQPLSNESKGRSNPFAPAN